MAKEQKITGRADIKHKKVSVTAIERGADGGPECYAILDRLVATVRTDLCDVRIALAWKEGWTVNKDGQLKAGKCHKANDLGREFMGQDVVILLNRELWPALTAEQREEMIYHELMHIVVELDKYGDAMRDERDHIVVRMRHHDIEEFHAVRDKYGHDNLGQIAADLLESARQPLLAETTNRSTKKVAAA